MRILLTGASGFLGSALARHLFAAGNQVALLLRPSSRLTRLQDLEDAFDIGRCANDGEVSGFVERIKPDVVIHTASAYGRQGETILQIADTNIRFGLQILQSLKSLGQAVTFINTGTALSPEVSLYALSKYHFLQWGQTLVTQSAGQLRFVNVLLQHMYGPGDAPSKFTTQVLHACQRNDLELKLTLGEQKRDFIYIDDVVNAYAILSSRVEDFEPFVEVQIGSGIAPTVREFVETVHRLTGSSTKLNFGAIPYRINEAMNCQAELGLMTRLGWKPMYDLESGLKKTIEAEFFN
jgi:nucleoside-diphosphate-sugar epimerase